MAALTIIFQNSESISPAISGFAVISLCANALDAAAAQLSHLLCALTGELFKVLPSIMLAVFQAFETGTLDHAEFLECCHLLVSAWL